MLSSGYALLRALLGFAPLCNLQALSTVVAEGPTTIEREEPVRLPDGRERIETEMVQLDLVGTFEMGLLVGPVAIRESPDFRAISKSNPKRIRALHFTQGLGVLPCAYWSTK